MNQTDTMPELGTPPLIRTLCEHEDAYAHGPHWDDLFVGAMRENIRWHVQRCEFYRTLLDRNRFSPDALTIPDDCAQIPFIHANFFKRHEILSVPRDQVVLQLTSSGTTGQKSQMFFDAWSIGSARRMVDFIYQARGWITKQPANYLLYAYEPLEGMNLGTTNTNVFLTQYAPPRETFYALRSTGDGGHEFDLFGCVEALKRYEREGLPVRILGFPAFLHFTLARMRRMKCRPLHMHPESLVVFGGGWKGYADQAITKKELYAAIIEQLGIPDNRIAESFGSVEHSIPYIECPAHHLHVPVWSRVFIRDVKTLAVLGYGREGFLQFLSPYILSVPAQSVLMGDLAILHPGYECSCGIATPFFEILGRAGVSKNKSCAVAAAELLKGR